MCLVSAAASAEDAPQSPQPSLPITGQSDPGMAPFDDLLTKFVAERKIPGAALANLSFIDIFEFDTRAKGISVTAATDVRSPLCGPQGASIVYGPQKGATGSTARALDSALKTYAKAVEKALGVRIMDVPGGGAAGGIGAGLIAFLGAEVRSGFDIVAQITHLYQRRGDRYEFVCTETVSISGWRIQ